MSASLSSVLTAFFGLLGHIRLAGYNVARLALAGIVVTYAFEVVARYLFNAPTWWSSELVSYLLCIMTFTMMPHVTATGGHVAVTILLEVLQPRWQQILTRAIAIAGCATCLALTVFASDETARQISRNIQMMAAQPIPKWWVSIWIVFGFTASTLEFLRHAIQGAPVTAATSDAAPAGA